MTDITIAPVQHEVVVPVSQARAFQLFTTHFDSWWPRAHHIGAAPLHRAVMEPRVGGRWYEVGVDGSECEWGVVLEWDEPSSFVVTWQLNGRFEYDPDLAHASEVAVTFTPTEDGSTLVAMEHRRLERVIAGEDLRKGVDSDGGWSTILRGFVQLAAASSH
ncbi:MAG TPA: SRPBCC family protein [Ilumatobacteraceae bacterium]